MFPDRDTKPLVTDQVCFQILVPREIMAQDPDTMAMYNEGDSFSIQMAEGSYLTSWTNQVNESFFMIFSERQYNKPASVGDWTRDGDMDEVRQLYRHYPKPVTRSFKRWIAASYGGSSTLWKVRTRCRSQGRCY